MRGNRMKRKFTVKCKMKEVSMLCLGFMFFFLFGMVWLIVKYKINPILASIIFVPLILLWLAGFLFLSFVYVRGRDNNIEFRNMFGIRRNIEIKDIKRVIWRTTETKFGCNEKVTVKSSSGSFSVETLMVNSGDFFKHITSNVSEEKITRKIKILNQK